MTDTQYLNRLEIAVSLRREGMYALALQVASGIRAERPEEYAVYHALGQTYTEIGEFDKALKAHEEAYRLLQHLGSPTNRTKEWQICALGLAQARLRAGKFDGSTWSLWEAGRCGISWSPFSGSKFYTGMEESVDSLLVQSEGGYGDTFMFMRWLPLLKSLKGVKRLGLMLWKPLVDFCDWSALGVDEVYEIDRDMISLGKWDYATSILSMPALFQMKSWEEIPRYPSGLHWLQQVIGFRSMTDNLRIGFCWRAEENTSPVRTKSLPLGVAETIIDELDKTSQVFSLSPQQADLYSTKAFEEPGGIYIEPEQMKGWKLTAAYISSMDFVLTVDTAVAHLAGLLGVPALVLLPCSSCWRWGLPPHKPGVFYSKSSHIKDAYHWYGPDLTYYRQPEPLRWDAHQIIQSLMERINGNTQA